MESKGEESKGEVSIEEIFADDNQAIQWLNSLEDTNLTNAITILNKYAQECLNELGKKDLSQGVDDSEKKKIIINVKRYLTKQENFSNKCLIGQNLNDNEKNQESFRLELFTQEEIDGIKRLTDEDIEKLSSEKTEENSEIISKIRKANRFYNMQLKLAHTARIVKVADEVLKQNKGNLNPELREIVMTSALLHDIGRFYQAKEYDDLADGKLKLNKAEHGQGHSKAGYYYSMMDEFRMNFFGDTVDKDLLIKTVAAFVVSYHSESNVALEEAGIVVNEENLSEILDEESLKKIITQAYSNAEYIKLDESDKSQQEFIRKFMHKMMLQKGADTLEALGIDQSRIEENITRVLESEFVVDTNNFFETYNKNGEQQNSDLTIEQLSSQLREAISKSSGMQFDTSDIQSILMNMASYDVAKSMHQMFSQKGNIEEEKIKQTLFAFPINIVTDADKIDILNQLACGTYPINYNPSEYKKFIDDKNYVSIPKEEAFQLFEEENQDIIINQKDKEDFYKYNGLKREDNISPVRSTLWLMNQFIFTNMRNKGSLMLVRDNRFIERTYEQFSEDENVQKILKPYMAYAMFFMDYISDKPNNLLSPEVMQKFCEEAYSKYKENDKLRAEYEELFEGDLLENREKFLEAKNNKMVITVQQIGKATINTPTIAKKEAEQVENSENIKVNTKEGEK